MPSFASAPDRSGSADLAFTDPLTGLGNHRRFYDKIDRLISDRADDPAPFAVGILDLDGFKPINDLFGRKAGDERRQSVLAFSRVLSAKALGIDRARKEDVLSLLAVRFVGGDAPAGTVELVFSGDSAIRLDVECIEARLGDTGGAWGASSRPTHRT